MHAASPDSGRQISIIGIFAEASTKTLTKKGYHHAASLYFPRVDVSCNVSILHYFLERLGQFLKKFWYIFLPRRTLIAIASFEKFRVIPNRFLTHENFILQ